MSFMKLLYVEIHAMASFISSKTFQTYSYAHFSLFSHLVKGDSQEIAEISQDGNDGAENLASGRLIASNHTSAVDSSSNNAKQSSTASLQSCRPETIRASSLTYKEHRDYLMLRNKLPHPDTISALASNKDVNYFKKLQAKVQQEQRLFLKAVQESLMARPSMFCLPDGISTYMQEMLLCHWKRALEYPRYYSIKDLIPLISTSYKGCVIFQHLHRILELGTVPYVEMPSYDKKMTLSRCYMKTNLKYPANDENQKKAEGNVLFKIPVSRDSNARVLAAKYGSNVVISSGSLRTVFSNNEQCLGNSWELPVIVEEYDKGNGVKEKVVYIDKPFKRQQLSVFEKNLLYHKRALKSYVLQPKHNKTMNFSGSQNSTKMASLKDIKVVASPDVNTLNNAIHANNPNHSISIKENTITKIPSVSLTTATNGLPVTSDISKQCSAEAGSTEDVLGDYFNCPSDSEDDRLLIDSSFECSSKNPSTHFKHDSSITDSCFASDGLVQSKSPQVCSQPPEVSNNSAELNDEEKIEDLNVNVAEQSPEVMQVTAASPKKLTLNDLLSPQISEDNKVDVDKKDDAPDLPCRSTLEAIEELQTKTFGSAKRTSVTEASDKINFVANMTENSQSFVPPLEGRNICYHLWRIGRLNMLVRCSIAGNTGIGKMQSKRIFWHVEPKMEYMVKYNVAEAVTYSECAQQWISTAVIPDMKLARVRINACTSQVTGIETLKLDEIASSKSGFRPQDCLQTLATILEKVYLLPLGKYVLSHMAGEGTCKILKEIQESERANCKSLYDFHQTYLKSCSAQCKLDAGESVVLPALDLNFILFTNKHFGRIPATFKPHNSAGGNVNVGTGKKKKKRKAKKQGNPTTKKVNI